MQVQTVWRRHPLTMNVPASITVWFVESDPELLTNITPSAISENSQNFGGVRA